MSTWKTNERMTEGIREKYTDQLLIAIRRQGLSLILESREKIEQHKKFKHLGIKASQEITLVTLIKERRSLRQNVICLVNSIMGIVTP